MDNTNIETHVIGTSWLSKLPPEISNLIGEQIYALRLFKSLGALAQTFNCPNLKSLGLGQGADLDFSYLWPAVIQTEDDDFLEQLCLLYQTRYKGSPLNLHTLRLGYGTSPYAPKLKNNHSYLKKLVSTKELRTLDLFNGTWVKYLGGDSFDNLPIDYQLLDDCESLTDLSVTNFEDDVKGWLSDKKRFSIRKISTADYSHESLEPVSKLDLPNLFINIYSCLTRLKLCIHFETQWDHFCSRLADLNSLTQLRLDTLFGRRIPLSKVPSLAFKNAACEMEIAYRYAQEISKIRPSLRYLMISVPRRMKVAWEIIPVGQGVRGQRLRQLRLKEMDSFELFLDTLENLEKPAGLPLESLWDAERKYPFLRWVPPDMSDHYDGFFEPEPEFESSDSEPFDSDSS
ncbi:hypothetical protein DID88_001442 [Monilinia fructigena]|uniref:Uncharacterized protein n=1 Tax=Monilinia fructigena TaxID=38457 RepID=A0A395IXW2_9HELO|nr:hypothetical protein DID88_001442 [Monilinia fructigena]